LILLVSGLRETSCPSRVSLRSREKAVNSPQMRSQKQTEDKERRVSGRRCRGRALVLLLVVELLVGPAAAGGAGADTDPVTTPASSGVTWLDAASEPVVFANEDALLEYLRTADVVSTQELATGLNRPHKVVLEQGGVRLHAVFRDVDRERHDRPRRRRRAYLDQRDRAVYEVAAYRLSRMLGLDLVPPAVDRTLHSRAGSLQVWLEGAAMALEHYRGRISPPDPDAWSLQLQRMHLFDALVGNADRNYGNILIDRRWRLWLVDHTQAFVKSPVPLDISRLARCERRLWDRLCSLDDNHLRQALDPWLSPHELDCLLARRRALVELIRSWIDERGADAVLYDLPAPLPAPLVWPWEAPPLGGTEPAAGAAL